jgi:class 3 adenylate cyclase
MALDITGYAANSYATQLSLRHRLFQAIQSVFARLAGGTLPADGRSWFCERGDGALIVLPGQSLVGAVLRDAVPDLVSRLASDNGVPVDDMRLRVAIHTGHAAHDSWGWIGTDVNHVFRLVDCDKLRRRESQGASAQTMLAISEAAYHHAKEAADLAETSAWRSRGVRTTHKPRLLKVTAKETRTRAWVIGINVADQAASAAAKPAPTPS